jgi:hypothetical protein
MFEENLGKGTLGFRRVTLQEEVKELLNIIETLLVLFLNKLS